MLATGTMMAGPGAEVRPLGYRQFLQLLYLDHGSSALQTSPNKGGVLLGTFDWSLVAREMAEAVLGGST
jgi:hypothetical protein